MLGCTHYPFLEGAIWYVMGEDVTLVSSDDGDREGRLPQLVAHGLRARRADAARRYRYEATGDDADDFLRLGAPLHRPRGRERVDLVQTGVIDLPRLDHPSTDRVEIP